jgi:hypothetical protein
MLQRIFQNSSFKCLSEYKHIFERIWMVAWLRCYATSQKLMGSILNEVMLVFFNLPNPSSYTMASGVDSASDRNEYQESWHKVGPPPSGLIV